MKTKRWTGIKERGVEERERERESKSIRKSGEFLALSPEQAHDNTLNHN